MHSSLEAPGLCRTMFQPDQLSLRVLEIKEHINLRGDYPLEAMISGTHHKAHLVANLALNDGPQAAAEHYRIPLATVYGALAFYSDHEAAIHEAIQEARKLGEQLGARSAQSALEEIKGRKNVP